MKRNHPKHAKQRLSASAVETKAKPSKFLSLPKDLLLCILSYFDLSTRRVVKQVCKRLNAQCDEKAAWPSHLRVESKSSLPLDPSTALLYTSLLHGKRFESLSLGIDTVSSHFLLEEVKVKRLTVSGRGGDISKLLSNMKHASSITCLTTTVLSWIEWNAHTRVITPVFLPWEKLTGLTKLVMWFWSSAGTHLQLSLLLVLYFGLGHTDFKAFTRTNMALTKLCIGQTSVNHPHELNFAELNTSALVTMTLRSDLAHFKEFCSHLSTMPVLYTFDYTLRDTQNKDDLTEAFQQISHSSVYNLVLDLNYGMVTVPLSQFLLETLSESKILRKLTLTFSSFTDIHAFNFEKFQNRLRKLTLNVTKCKFSPIYSAVFSLTLLTHLTLTLPVNPSWTEFKVHTIMCFASACMRMERKSRP